MPQAPTRRREEKRNHEGGEGKRYNCEVGGKGGWKRRREKVGQFLLLFWLFWREGQRRFWEDGGIGGLGRWNLCSGEGKEVNWGLLENK